MFACVTWTKSLVSVSLSGGEGWDILARFRDRNCGNRIFVRADFHGVVCVCLCVCVCVGGVFRELELLKAGICGAKISGLCSGGLESPRLSLPYPLQKRAGLLCFRDARSHRLGTGAKTQRDGRVRRVSSDSWSRSFVVARPFLPCEPHLFRRGHTRYAPR